MENQTEIGILVAAVCLAMLSIGLGIITFMNVHRKKILEKESRIREIETEKKIEIFKASTQAEEKQKVKIARDLHDGISPSLSAVIRSLDKNIKDFDTGKFNLERLKEDLNTIELAKDNLRTISHDLIPPNILSYGLIKALNYHMNTIRDLSESKADFENKTQFGETIPFTKTDELNIFRICLEILNNLMKHAKYNYLKVTVESDEENLIIDFMHDGKGITNNEVHLLRETAKGVGLNSIFSRAMLMNCSIDYTVEREMALVNLKIPFSI